MPSAPRPPLALTLALALTLTLGAASHATAQTTRDSAAIRITTNPVKTVMLPAREVARIGTAEGDAKYELFKVSSTAIDAKGNYYVGMEFEIRVFDARGKYVKTIGRQGKGPGEFNYAPLLWFATDTMIAVDRNLMRSTAFTQSGNVLATYNAYAHPGLTVRPIARSDAGWIALAEKGGSDDNGEAALMKALATLNLKPGDLGEMPPLELRRYFPKNDSLGDVVYRVREKKLVGVSKDLSPIGMSPRSFDDEPAYALDARGFAFLKNPTEYRIDVLDKRGKQVGSIRRDFARTPITMNDFDELPQLMVDAAARSMIPGPGVKIEDILKRTLQSFTSQVERQKKIPLPSYRFPVGRLLVSPNGILWAERADYMKPAQRQSMKNGPTRFATRWDIFDTGSRYIGTTDLPVGYRPHTVTDDGRVAGVYKDDDGVEYIITFQVVPRRR